MTKTITIEYKASNFKWCCLESVESEWLEDFDFMLIHAVNDYGKSVSIKLKIHLIPNV